MKKVIPGKLYCIDVNVFKFTVVFITDSHCWFDGSLTKFLKTNGLDRTPKDTMLGWLGDIQLEMTSEHKLYSAYTMVSPEGLVLINFFEWGNSPSDMGTLVHEIQHAVYKRLKAVGIEHSDETDEVFSYVQGYIVEELLYKIEKHG